MSKEQKILRVLEELLKLEGKGPDKNQKLANVRPEPWSQTHHSLYM